MQAETANRTASETTAALRKALEALPKELPPAATPATETTTAAPGAPATVQEPLATQMQLQNETDGEKLEQVGTPKREPIGTNVAKPRPRESTFMARLMRRISGQ